MKDYVAGCQLRLLFALEILFSKVDTIRILSRQVQNIEMQLVHAARVAIHQNLQVIILQAVIIAAVVQFIRFLGRKLIIGAHKLFTKLVAVELSPIKRKRGQPPFIGYGEKRLPLAVKLITAACGQLNQRNHGEESRKIRYLLFRKKQTLVVQMQIKCLSTLIHKCQSMRRCGQMTASCRAPNQLL